MPALAEAFYVLADFLGDSGIGEVADDGFADADAVRPALIVDGTGEVRRQVVELFLEDAARGFLHLFGLGGSEIRVEPLEGFDAAVDIVPRDRFVPLPAKLLLESLPADVDLQREIANLLVVGVG